MTRQETIHAYFDCFARKDRAGLERLLPKKFHHLSAYGFYDDRDAMLDEIWPSVGENYATNIQIFGEAPDFMVRYTLSGKMSANMAEHFHFDGDKIAQVEVYTGRPIA